MASSGGKKAQKKALERWKLQKVVDRRISQSERDEALFYYELRHDEADWTEPVTIEKNAVFVNFWGTLVTSEPLHFGKADYIELSKVDALVLVDIAYCNRRSNLM